MQQDTPIYDTRRDHDAEPVRSNRARYTIKVARSLHEIMQVIALRAAVFLSEQECPYFEEFDGNDFCGLHLIGYRGDEPAACLRVRFFAGFAKLERLAVRYEFRNSRVAFQIVHAGIELACKKGYVRIYGHAQDRLVGFWSRFGAHPMPNRRPLVFSDFSYTEMLLETEPRADAITLDSNPYEIIRPEGAWQSAGPLDQSAARPVTSPLRRTDARDAAA
jgi:predicted GNAT family N-acyltransferase